MIASRGLSGSGRRRTAPWCGLRRGEKAAGPNPPDRGKPGDKEHLLVDGRGVPLSTVLTAANVNDGPMLAQVLTALPIVRPHPDLAHPHHLCLDAAFANAPARDVGWEEGYPGHIAPKGGRAPEGVVHPGGQARRWKVERTHAWHDRFRRLVVKWEQTPASRSAFMCLANALIAYRMEFADALLVTEPSLEDAVGHPPFPRE
jgi:putative transposase